MKRRDEAEEGKKSGSVGGRKERKRRERKRTKVDCGGGTPGREEGEGGGWRYSMYIYNRREGCVYRIHLDLLWS